MRSVALAALLLACSSSATVPAVAGDAATDARRPPDDSAGWSVCAGFYQDGCTTQNTMGAERLYTAGAAWLCLNGFDVPESQREAARACACANIGSLPPSSIDPNGQRTIRAACCGHAPATPSAWCPDAG